MDNRGGERGKTFRGGVGKKNRAPKSSLIKRGLRGGRKSVPCKGRGGVQNEASLQEKAEFQKADGIQKDRGGS